MGNPAGHNDCPKLEFSRDGEPLSNPSNFSAYSSISPHLLFLMKTKLNSKEMECRIRKWHFEGFFFGRCCG